MTSKTIREKLKAYIDSADTKKIKAIYTMVEDDIESMTLQEDYGDISFEELENRSNDFKNDTAKFYSEEETDAAARNLLRAKRKK